MKQASYSLRTPRNYPENQGIWEVVWHDVFMPFDVVCGVDYVPPDNFDYTADEKTHWWATRKTITSRFVIEDISSFIEVPTRSYATLEEAINFCIEWRKNWLEKELAITFSSDTPPPADE